LVKNESNIYSVGFNVFGQLIDGTTFYRSYPVKVQNPNFNIVDIAAGYGHTLILKTGGDLFSIGYNIVIFNDFNSLVWSTWCWKHNNTNSTDFGIRHQSRN
jgi:alpha-tubulin suppressor-like RCC1 family protein